MLISVLLAVVFLTSMCQTTHAACSAGEVEVTIEVVTDTYGYECYWELVPSASPCGTGTIFTGGNLTVGCSGGCLQAQDPSGYANNSTITEGPWCLPLANNYDIVSVDDWGDGGTTFNVYMDGALTNTFTASAVCTETFTFTTTSAPNNNLTMSAGFYNTSSDSAYIRYYTQIPEQQAAATTLMFGGHVKNNGVLVQNNTNFFTDITGPVTYSGSSTAITLNPGVQASFDISTPFTPSLQGTYGVTFSTTSSATDDVPSDNSLTESFIVGDTTYARDNGVSAATYWYGAATLYHAGHNFEVYAADTVSSISLYLSSFYSAGNPINYHLWDGGRTTILATATHIVAAGEPDSWVTLGLDSGPYGVAPGTYFVGIETFTDTATYEVDGTTSPPGVCWGDINKDGTWTANDQTILLRVNLNSAAGGGCNISATTSTSNVSCNGGSDGSATATVTGGTAPFNYVWTPGGGTTATINGLSAGTYSVVITDAAACVTTGSATITEPGVFTATTTGSNPSFCGGSDGTAMAIPTGGVSPFSYSWDSSTGNQTTQIAIGLAAGNYSVTITDGNGCTALGSTALSDPGGTTLTSSSTDPTACGLTDGTATVTATGGTAPYTYAWDDPANQTNQIATGLSGGTFSVTVTDANGCTAMTSVTLTSASGPTVNTTGTNPTSCGSTDGTATATVTGGSTPYTYAWSSGGNTLIETNLGAGTYTVTVTDADGCAATSSTTLTSSGAPTLTTTATDASCSSPTGTASVFATGGTTPYSYLWSNGQTSSMATGLSPGSHSVTVTDNVGCASIASATVGSSGIGPTLTFITSNLNCFDDGSGSAAVAASGATSPYTYYWSTGATTSIISGMDAGIYDVTVSDNLGCQTIQSITLTEPAEIVSISTVSNANCGASDGVASVFSTGGVSPYNYQWDAAAGNQTTATATGLSAGTYDVTTTDANGCPMPSQVNVSNIGAPSLTLVGADAVCFNTNTGSVTSVASGGSAPYTYSWNTGSNGANLSNVSAGTYTLTLTDTSGCIAIQSAIVDEPPVFYGTTSYLNVSSSSSCDGQATISPFGGTGAYTYSWDDPGTQSNATAIGLCLGTYNVTVTDANGCNFTLPVYVDSIAMGVTSLEAHQTIEVYPNPAVGTVNISWDMPSEELVIIRLFGLDGKEIHSATITDNAAYVHKVELTGYAKGLYFIQVATCNNLITHKLVLH